MGYVVSYIVIAPHSGSVCVLDLSKVLVRAVQSSEMQRFGQLMQEHHYLGALPKISETI